MSTQPAGIPDGFEPHVQLLYDLQLLAYQSDLTRVITFMYGREQTGRAVSADRRPRAASPADAPSERPGEDGRSAPKIQTYHVKLFADYLEKLRAHAGRRRLAARSRDPSLRRRHQQQRPPHARPAADAAGRAAARGTLKGGRHLVYPEDTPLTNLQLTLLNKMGVPTEKLGDSTGQFNELSGLTA